MTLAEISQSLRRFGDGTVAGRLSHAFFQNLSQQPGDASVPFRRLNASPLGDVLFERDSYVA